MASPFFTVVIPTHNRPAMLVRALESVARQSCPDFEVVVVDDGSTVPVAEEAIPSELRGKTRLLRHEQAKGVSAARNAAIAVATGEYLAFLDDDDTLCSDYLERARAFLVAGGDSLDGVCIGRTIIFEDGGTMRREVSTVSAPGGRDCGFRELAEEIALNWGTPGTIVRRESVINAGLFDVNFRIAEDRELFCRLFASGCRWGVIAEPLMEHYFHTEPKLTSSADYVVTARYLEMLIDKNRTAILGSDRLSYEMGRRVSAFLYRSRQAPRARRRLRELLGWRLLRPEMLARLVKFELGYPARRVMAALVGRQAKY